MKNPRLIQTLKEGASFKLPSYQITNDGVEDHEPIVLDFCKGDKSNADVFRQPGLFTETLIQASKQYLESVNKDKLATRETSMAITKLDEALMWLQKRSEDRKLRGVEQTYKQ